MKKTKWSYKPKLHVIPAFRLACQLGLTRAGFLPSKCERGAGDSRMSPKGAMIVMAHRTSAGMGCFGKSM